jgi:DNA repair exonuclease SbcCD nuclease subunit
MEGLMAKFIHIADLHLDRTFSAPEGAMQIVKNLNETTFTKIIDTCIQREVDVVIFAGDTFHQANSSVRIQSLFEKECTRLFDLGIEIVFVFGNHDYYEEEKYWIDFSTFAHCIFSESVETVQIQTKNNERISVSGFSYTHPVIEVGKVAEFPTRDLESDLHIGVYHGMVGKTGNYAPFQLEEMYSKNYDYWALGHIHQPEVLSTKPLIVYPGTPQGHHIKEDGDGGIVLGEKKNGLLKIEKIKVSSLTYETVEMDLSDYTSLNEVKNRLENALKMNVIYRLVLKNTTHLGTEFKRSVEVGEFLNYLSTFSWVEQLLIKQDESVKTLPLRISKEEFMEILSETDAQDSITELTKKLPYDVLKKLDFDFYDGIFHQMRSEIESMVHFDGEDET